MTIEIGLTGNIGAGKSSVARAFERLGADVIDADELAARALEDPQVLAELRATFGPDVAPGDTVDRAALAARAFSDEGARRRLEGIIHPRVRAAARERARRLLEAADPPAMIVHDVPLLFEAGLEEDFDAVVVVDAPLEMRIERVQRREGWTADAVRARDRAQWPSDAKRRAADEVIDNDGTPAQLEARVREVWQRLQSLASFRSRTRDAAESG